jgi:nitrate reductase gamma subunit
MAGLLYHIGTFTAIVLFFLLLVNIELTGSMQWVLIGILAVSGLSGCGIFLKRITIKKLRSLSNPDDYISNLLVTVFQFFTLGMLVKESFAPIYFLCVSLLLLYLPLGKLKHSLYFFSARYHLGFFYGWRGIWPSRKM